MGIFISNFQQCWNRSDLGGSWGTRMPDMKHKKSELCPFKVVRSYILKKAGLWMCTLNGLNLIHKRGWIFSPERLDPLPVKAGSSPWKGWILSLEGWILSPEKLDPLMGKAGSAPWKGWILSVGRLDPLSRKAGSSPQKGWILSPERLDPLPGKAGLVDTFFQWYVLYCIAIFSSHLLCRISFSWAFSF